jgi:membrane-associated PAP2 superfamily phosphatase
MRRGQQRWRALPLWILALLLSSQTVVADDAQPETDGSPALSAFPKQIFLNFGRLAAMDNLVPLGLGVIASGGAHTFDEEVQDYFAEERRLEALGEIGHVLGSTALAAGVSALLLTTAYRGDNQRYRRMAFSLGQGLVLNYTLTTTLKVTIDRERPNGESHDSFPSGHASTAFVCATVVGHHYGTRTKIIAYTVAGLVAVSRLEKNKHWLSDVVAGATLGYIVGRTVVRGTREASRVSVSPMLVPDGLGVAVSVRF